MEIVLQKCVFNENVNRHEVEGTTANLVNFNNGIRF